MTILIILIQQVRVLRPSGTYESSSELFCGSSWNTLRCWFPFKCADDKGESILRQVPLLSNPWSCWTFVGTYCSEDRGRITVQRDKKSTSGWNCTTCAARR